MPGQPKQFYIPLYATVDPQTGEVEYFIDEGESFPVDWVWNPNDDTWEGYPTTQEDRLDRERIIDVLINTLTTPATLTEASRRPEMLEQSLVTRYLRTLDVLDEQADASVDAYEEAFQANLAVSNEITEYLGHPWWHVETRDSGSILVDERPDV